MRAIETRVLVFFLSFFLLNTLSLFGDTVYYRNFERDQADLDDWFQFGGNGSATLSEHGFSMTGNNAWFLEGPIQLVNASIRTQFAFEGEESNGIGIFANGDFGAITAYQAGFDPNGGVLYIGWNNPAYQRFDVQTADFDVKAGEEVILQFDIFDHVLALTAWRPGESKPSNPQIGLVDDEVRLGAGTPGISFDSNESMSTASLRFFRVDNDTISQNLQCDFDHSGQCTVADLDVLLYRGTQSHDDVFDLNGSGDVNQLDVGLWLEMAGGYFKGDLNLDGNVDAGDLNQLALNWNTEVVSWSEGDIDGDRFVDSGDLNQLALNWQVATQRFAVPEPSAATLFVFILFFVRFRRPG